MLLIRPYFKIMYIQSNIMEHLEMCARTCYKSEDKICKDSAIKLMKSIMSRGHHSIIEHASVSVKFVCDRGVSHEIVRHRLASYSQESTRYCNYTKNHMTFIIPEWFVGETEEEIDEEIGGPTWLDIMHQSENEYNFLIGGMKWTPQQARSILPNSLKTEINMTANLREWRHFFSVRVPKAAHPQMRELSIPLLKEFQEAIPVIFDDINI